MLVVIIGQSGSGKTTIEKELIFKGFEPIVIYHDRPPRKDDPYWYETTALSSIRRMSYTQTGVNGNTYGYQSRLKLHNYYVVSFTEMSKARAYVKSLIKCPKVKYFYMEPNPNAKAVLVNRGTPAKEIIYRLSQSNKNRIGSACCITFEKAYATIMNKVFGRGRW